MTEPAATPTPTPMAMFPLGSVLLPGMALPLHVFEPRYRAMVTSVLAADPPEFGVVLIERGSEVGGGDVRADLGCVARVLDAAEHPDGRWELLALGTRRIEVLEWLPDEPHPQALVVDRPDDEPDEQVSADALEQLATDTLEVAALAAQLGPVPLPAQIVLSEDPELRVYQLATLCPIGPLDRLAVLRSSDLHQRAELLGELVAEQRLLLEARRDLG